MYTLQWGDVPCDNTLVIRTCSKLFRRMQNVPLHTYQHTCIHTCVCIGIQSCAFRSAHFVVDLTYSERFVSWHQLTYLDLTLIFPCMNTCNVYVQCIRVYVSASWRDFCNLAERVYVMRSLYLSISWHPDILTCSHVRPYSTRRLRDTIKVVVFQKWCYIAVK